MSSLSFIEKKIIEDLFNQDGYVLDFSTEKFDMFTQDSIGIALCEKYNLSKGKSLMRFVSDANDNLVKKLLDDLLLYFETYHFDDIDEQSYRKYDDCKKLTYQLSNRTLAAPQLKELRTKFDTKYMDLQITSMEMAIENHPTDAIGKAKELLESCFKSILEAQGEVIDKKWDVPTLSKKTFKYLKITPEDISDEALAFDVIKKILGNLSAISVGIAELRNPFGTGHGKNIGYKGLAPRHARLAVRSAVTVVQFIWETYEEQKEKGFLS